MMFLFLALILVLSASLLYITRSTPALDDGKNTPESDSERIPSVLEPMLPTLSSHNESPNASRNPEQSQLPKQGVNTQESGSEKVEEIPPDSITIAIFCALAYEVVAVENMLDEEYECRPKAIGPIKYVYSFGRIKKHKIVIAQPHQMGTVAAAHCATAVSQQFPNVRFALMVGIGAGIPDLPKHDIRLGDIAVSVPQDAHAGVIQYDFGKYEQDGFVLKGCLNKPPSILTSADKWMEREELKEKSPLREALRRITNPKFFHPNTADILFDDKFHHLNRGSDCGACEASKMKMVVSRTIRPNKQPIVHRGLILSGNGVVKNPRDRDHLRRYTDAICYEMEAAGIMDEIPCLIVRGICDYADTHKQDGWHYYAAAVAAAYCRTLLCKIDSQGVEETESRLAGGMDTLIKIATELWDGQGDMNKTTKNIQQTLHLERLKIAQGAEFDSYGIQHEECLPGTRVELLNQIKEWAGSPHGRCIFWLNGMAGTGKSTISKTVSRHFKEQRALGASFFFKRGEEERRNAKKLFPTLMKQLATSIPQLVPSIQKTLANDPNISERALREQFERLLLQPLLEVKESPTITMVVVIDALDECDQEDDIKLILRLLPQVRKSTAVNLRFFLTSRPDLPINLGFSEIKNTYQDLILHQVALPVIEHDISQYFQIRLAQLRQIRNLPSSWPGDERVKLLIEQAVPLFISATTMYRFISDEKWNPEKRLQAILTGHTTYVSKMGSTYMTVLNHLLSGQDKWESQQLVEEFKEIVGVIVLLATPLSAVSLSQLVNLDLGDVNRRLNSLHSVLHVPPNPSIPVRLLHLSFRDFLLDTKTKQIKESRKFWINAQAVHTFLTDKCLKIMKHSLRKNICNLPSMGIQRSEIDKYCVDHCLPPEIQYACRYWAEHLVQSQDPARALINTFSVLKVHLLHWLEAMSILGLISEVVGIMTKLQPIIQSCKNSKVSNFYYDAKRFVLKNQYMTDIAPLQLYSSGLMFCPRESFIRGIFKEELSNWYQLPRVEEKWNADLLTLEGHSQWVSSVTYSPDGQLLASSSHDKTIKLWDPSTGKLRQTLEGHSDWVSSVSFSPDGQLLASSSYDKTIKLWDPSTGELQCTLEGHSDWISLVSFSPDGQLLASSSYDKTIKLWDPSTSKLCQTLEGHSNRVLSISFSLDGQLLASSSYDKTIKLWDPSTGELYCTLEGHSYSVWSVNFSPDRWLLASGSDDCTIKLWDPSTGELYCTLEGHSHVVLSVTFSPDGQLLASGSQDETIKLWDPSTGELYYTLEGHSYAVLSVTFSPDSRLLASGSEDCTIKLWDPSTGELYYTLEGHSYAVLSVTFSPDSQLLASGSHDQTVKLWDSSTSKLRQPLEGHSHWVQSVTFSPDGQLLASGSNDKTIKLWDPSTGELCRTLEGHSDRVLSVSFSPDSQLLASSSDDKTIKLWDPSTSKLHYTLEGHSDQVLSVSFSPDSQLLASSSQDKTIKLWDPSTGELHHTLEGHSDQVLSVSFSPDSQLLASSSYDKTIKLWDSSTGELRRTLEGHSHWVSSVTFSPDGQFLASSSYDKTIKLWDSSTGELRRTLEGHSHWAQSEHETISIQDDQWICLQGKRILWLPVEYRARCLAINAHVFALGHANGRVSFFSIKL